MPKRTSAAAPRGDGPIRVRLPATVKQFAAAAGRRVGDVMVILTFRLGIPGKSLDSDLSRDDLELLGLELNRPIEFLDDPDA